NKNEFENISNLHFEKCHLDKTLNYFEKFLYKQLKSQSKSDESIGDVYEIIGNISLEKFDYDKALINYLNLLEIKSFEKSPDDYSLINIYKSLGHIYLKKNLLNKSLFYFNRSNDCQLKETKIFDENIYSIIGNIYLKKHYAIDISFHLNENNLNEFYLERKYFQDNLFYFENFLEKFNENCLLKVFSLEQIYLIIAHILLEKQEYFRSLTYFHQLINCQQNNFSLLNIYIIIAKIYYQQKFFSQSLHYYRQSLILSKQIQPTNHLLIKKLEHHIRQIIIPNI
ncbi:unnamed protein product, partial [Adineta steineri]